MNISLRKANAIQASINDALRSVKITTRTEINEFQDAKTEMVTANNTLFANDARRQKLLLSLYNIRSLVGTANVQSGIDTKLATAAFNDKRISPLEELSGSEVVSEITVIEGKLEKIRNRKEDSRASLYGRDDVVDSGVVEKSQIEEINNFIKDLKKQKQKLNDEVLELNVRTEIELSEETVNVLKSENLI
jgi:hypothetical protein